VSAAGEVLAPTTPGSAPEEPRAGGDYLAVRRRRRLIVAGLAVLTAVAFAATLLVGAGSMSVGEFWSALVTPSAVPRVDAQIVWNIRMPFAVTAVVAGASLALAGVQMQTVLGNPLAEPYTLGVSAAAGFGAALVLVGSSLVPAAAFLGTAGSAWCFAMLACAVILGFGTLRGAGTESLILLGIAMVFLFSALLALLQYLASEVEIQQLVFWTFGNLTRTTWPQIAVMAAVPVVITPLLRRASWTLTAFRLGDDRARALGVPVTRVRVLVLLGVSLLAATTVAFTGTIGFVGLVGPHAARILVGDDQRLLLPASMLCGAVLLCAASVASTAIMPGVIIPVGIITSLVGVPVFLVIVMSTRRRMWS
jgi:iron complex transport system permease protein